jgi:predicted enzyme related to lactoylglutathione lyase
MPVSQNAFVWYELMTTEVAAAKQFYAGRIAQGGGQVLQAPHQVPGGGWIVQATDPQGARFALVGPRK